MAKTALLLLLLWTTPSHDPVSQTHTAPPPLDAAAASSDNACKGPVLGECSYRFCKPFTPGSGCVQCPGKPNCCDKKTKPKPKPPIS